MYNRILCAIDLNDLENSRDVLKRVGSLSKGEGAAVMLLNVLTPLPLVYVEYLPADFDAAELKAAKKRLLELMQEVDDAPHPVSCTVRRGTPYVEILNEAEAVKADLIIIGSHQPSFASKLLGSNASSIVRHAKVDVLIVRNDRHV